MKKLIYLVIIFFLLPSAFSIETYNETGGKKGDFIAGRGIFNSQLTTDSASARTLSSGAMHPLVSDLDNDGVNEIIVRDGSNIRLYQGSSLDIVDSFALTGSVFTNLIAFDIDADGKAEVIIGELSSSRINIIKYNGTSIFSQTTLPIETEDYEEGIIKCGKAESCLILVTSSLSSDLYWDTSAYSFSSSSIGARKSFHNATNNPFCLPIIPAMSFSDYDNDGAQEYIASFISVSGSSPADENLFIEYFNQTGDAEMEINLNSDNPFGFEDMTSVIIQSSNPIDCSNALGKYDSAEDPPGRFITSPLVMDIDGSPSNGLETVVGFMKNSDEFIMQAFESDGGFLGQFPEILDADGIIVSNPIQTNVFSDSQENQDFCVLGFQSSIAKLDLLCGSKLRTGFFSFESDEFFFDTSGIFNITIDFLNYNPMIHSVQHSTQTPNDLNEILTAYGVFEVDDSNDALNRIYPITNRGLSCIQVDAEKIGSEDLICLKSTQLSYIDDGLSNQDAIITGIEFNPCIDSVIKVNSTMSIVVTVEDQNAEALTQDLVSSEVQVYKDTLNQINSSIFNVSSGTEMPHQFILNQTGVNRKIGIQGFDTGTGVKDSKEFSFSVSTIGVEFGDCVSTFSFIPEEDEAEIITEATLTEDASENSITSGILTVAGITGLSGTTFWLVLMVAFTLGIWFRLATIGAQYLALGTISIFNVLMILLGARLGILSTSLVVIIVVLSIVIIGVFLGRFLTGLRATD